MSARIPCYQSPSPVRQDASMDIRAVAFDANGTLVRILTEDGAEEIFRAAGHFLTYQGIDLCREQVRDLYFRIMSEQQHASPEEHPEFDAAGHRAGGQGPLPGGRGGQRRGAAVRRRPGGGPGQVVIQVTVESAAEPEGEEDLLEGFHRDHRDAIRQLQRDIPQRRPRPTGSSSPPARARAASSCCGFPGRTSRPEANLTPVMARLGQADLETLDTLITRRHRGQPGAGRPLGPARIRERPAYAQLRERAREIEDLKSQL